MPHPPPDLDDVFRALADPGRRQLLDSLNGHSGQTLGQLCADMKITRQSVSQHLGVLESAGLVNVVWRGREKLHYLNSAPITELSQRWMHRYEHDRVELLSHLKATLEEHQMDRPSFVYCSYIHTTPQRLWQALIEPAFTKQYWGVELQSDWNAGSPLTWHQWDLEIAAPDQVVLESAPYRRLAYAWHTFTPEWRAAAREKVGFDEDFLNRIAAEPLSKVTFEIEDLDTLVKLTVTHDGFPAESEVLPTISQGWPHILSNLKTLLETGEVLPAPQTENAAVAS